MQTEIDIVGRLLSNVVRIAALSLFAGVLGMVTAIVYRWYVRSQIPEGLAALVGLSGVAAYLNTYFTLGGLIAEVTAAGGVSVAALQFGTVVVNSSIIGISAIAAVTGGRVGDRMGESAFATAEARSLDVSRIARAVGRTTAVTLPDEIADMDGYDPVAPSVKASLAGETFFFPRRLTLDELRERLVERLKHDFGVGHADLDLSEEGNVDYLALGSRESGIGPTLPPETCGVAVRADPAFAASAGDVVQVFQPGPDGPECVANAELRATADDVVTLAVDAADVSVLDPAERYRIVTLPVEPRTDREFASLLRTAEETMGVVTVGADSPLVGTTVGSVDASVVAIRTGGQVEPIPSRSRTLAAGDSLYVVARSDQLRKLDATARPAAA